MVTFICNSCGQSVKKQQVEKHCQTKCRDCQSLACVDCGKDFWGNDYQTHTKCISENEKYGGKDYKAKENKGERKQEEWFRQVQEAIDKCTDQSLKQWLQKLENYPNVPRKKAKFENFIRTNLRVPPHLQSRVWDAISAELNKPKEPAENGQSPSNNTPNGDVTKPVPANSNTNNSEAANHVIKLDNGTETKKLSKRERKEERKKAKHKEEKKDRKNEEAMEQEEEIKEKKKKKKRKREEEEDEEEEKDEVPSCSSENKKKKKKKAKQIEEEPVSKRRREDSLQEAEELNTSQELPKTKFNWESTIVAVLEKQDDKEISVKKLRKKVLAEYHASGTSESRVTTEEKLLSKFSKKIEKNPRFRVLKDRVKLLS